MAYTYNEILFSLKKEGHCDTCYNMDEPSSCYVKWNKPITKELILYDSTYKRHLEYSNSQTQKVNGAIGWGVSNGYRVSAGGYKKVRWWWLLHNSVNILNGTERYS